MIEHVPGCVEAGPDTDGPLPSPSLIGLLEQIRRDIESQTLELKRCITFSIPSSLKQDAEDLPPRASTAPDNGSLKRSGFDGCQQAADDVFQRTSRPSGLLTGADGLSMAASTPFPPMTNAHWAPSKVHTAAVVAPPDELCPVRSRFSKRPGENDVSGSEEVQSELFQVRNSVLRNAGVAAPKHVGFGQDREEIGSGEGRSSLESEETDLKRLPPNSFGAYTKPRRSHRHLINDDPDQDQSLNTLAQKAWSHLSTPKKWNKRKVGMKTVLRQDSQSIEENVFFRVTNAPSYELASAMLILLNAFTIALETHLRCRRAMNFDANTVLQDEVHWIVLRDIFCLLFFIELSLRIAAQKWEFLTSADWEWNVFDIVVVLSALVETFVSHAKGNQSNGQSSTRGFDEIIAHSSLLRILRLLRIVRVLRVVSVSRTMGKLLCFQDLRTMVSALCGALKSLLWVVVTMLLIVLIFAIYFTEGAIDRFIEGATDPELDTEALRAKYGGLPTSMLSLLKAITGGEDWGDTLEPLEVLPVLYPAVFMVYVLFGTLALMNIVTAVFVDSTVQRSRNDQNYIIQAENWSKKEFIQTMCFIFEELDSDCSGQISLDELKKFIESSTIATYFSALDLNITEVRTLFSLIDVDHSGTIDRDEFIWGCLRLKGDAKSLDLALLQYDVKAIQQVLQEIFDVLAPDDHMVDSHTVRSNGHEEAMKDRDAILAAS